ncbi:glycine betaine/proline transport system substrate-binding protein [Cohaesibacter sp. ES.047]|uniref:ABC transporter substrate-binding protein n=1 Tax=Cohaesibacter sp. ES.047 TaxID=1798205 RepID=UPI000BB868D5|nr:ABC transporter substrate-binding protein [Cohaesibacter sp. ES.047]SNY90146.1 glycine betaine/proline transport system substrate-binding protein [Cohaesibacter sp. ES.047]
MKRLLLAALMLSGSALSSNAADCGKVTIADMNWSSATLIANVEKIILTQGFGCDAELIPGDTMPTGASMTEKGEPDIAPEFWSNSMREVIDKGVEEGRLAIAGKSLSDGGEEGFWVPNYMVEKEPSLATIEGVIEHADLFPHPEDDTKSAFYGCPAGWNCQISSGNLFRAMNLEDAGFEIVDPGSGAGLSGSIAKAYERGEGWFGYYWAPTAVLGKYQMTKVDFGSGIDEEEFKGCTTQNDCADPKVTMYPPSLVQAITTGEFAKNNPEIMDFLGKLSFTNKEMNALLAWMEDNQADGEIAGIYFLKNHEDKWTEWLSDDMAAKVKAAVAEM